MADISNNGVCQLNPPTKKERKKENEEQMCRISPDAVTKWWLLYSDQ